MPVVDGREYRSIDIGQFEAKQGGYTVEGYATTFGQPYDMGLGASEVIDARALDGADMGDVIFQLNHEGPVLARQRNGTLSLDVDAHGLHVVADLGGCEAGRQLHESIRNGVIDRMSWGFAVDEDGWEYDPGTRTSTVARVKKVYDVSAVSIPANDGTEIKARSYLDGAIEAGLLEEQSRREAGRALARLTLTRLER